MYLKSLEEVRKTLNCRELMVKPHGNFWLIHGGDGLFYKVQHSGKGYSYEAFNSMKEAFDWFNEGWRS